MMSCTVRDTRRNEQGFTLPELLVVIAIMSVLATIAVPAWISMVNARAADAATKQVAADFRLAHSKATNRLENYKVDFATDGLSYTIAPSAGGTTISRTFKRAKLYTAVDYVVFRSDGQANITLVSGSDQKIGIGPVGGSATHNMVVNNVTSSVKID